MLAYEPYTQPSTKAPSILTMSYILNVTGSKTQVALMKLWLKSYIEPFNH